MKTILLVDDDPEIRETIAELLNDEYRVIGKASGDEALSEANTNQGIDIFLLDVNLPGISGYELCRMLKEKPAFEYSAFIFLSGMGGDDDIVEGFEVGGDDYIVKPVRSRELIAKLQSICTLKERTRRAQDDAQMAQKVAFNAMSDSSQLGRVIEFLTEVSVAESTDALMHSLFRTLDSLGLNCEIQVRMPAETFTCTPYDISSPLVAKLIDQAWQHGRIIDFHQRTLYNAPHISILVKNMPLDNPDEYGRLKDTLASLVVGADTRLKSLMNESIIRRSSDKIEALMGEIKDNVSQQSQKAHQLMNDLFNDMRETMIVTALSEEQEDYILSMLDTHIKALVQLVMDGEAVNSQLRELFELIQQSEN
ncbi:MAG: response regulator [Pseudomonadales bacterium]|uniref:Response regulator receiver n=1 Tax=Oleiphilus messinensis TaxID=141451 RepID=A0A1Y0IFC9_9GAMM|nr:response regulator [Oleiphilus messinensis]ARU58195.1 response regulator receiver [Oleiphilus messinensis]MCG8613595.1 response regulator [Pseudomonadales bacterium]